MRSVGKGRSQNHRKERRETSCTGKAGKAMFRLAVYLNNKCLRRIKNTIPQRSVEIVTIHSEMRTDKTRCPESVF